MLQEQNEDLHNTLRQTVARMECLGAEFITEHHQLESELQRTRVELSGMMDKFTRSKLTINIAINNILVNHITVKNICRC